MQFTMLNDSGIWRLWIVISLLGFPCSSADKESAGSVGDLGSIPGLGRSHGEGKGYPLQYSGLENSMDYIVHGVAKNWTELSNFHTLVAQSCLTPWVPMNCSPRLLCPRASPGKNTGVGCHSLLQEIFLTQDMNLGLPRCRQILYHLSHSETI